MKLEEAIQHALDGQAMLFTGSGFSVGAQPVGFDKFLTGRGLASYLYKECEIETDDDQLNISSQMYAKKFGSDRLHETLVRLFTTERISSDHEYVSTIPWQTVFTTNYDDVLESSYANADKKLGPLTPNDSVKGRALSGDQCVHINGYLPGSVPSDLSENIKLSNASYLTEAFAGSLWGFAFRKSLHYAKVVIMIGYSMYDIDIQRVIHNVGGYREKIIFIEDPQLDVDSIEYGIQSDFGQIYPVGLAGFVERIKKVKQTYIPIDESDVTYYLQKVEPDTGGSELRDDKLFDLLFRGQADLSLISDSLRGELSEPYFIRRTAHDSTMRNVESGGRVFFVHADMANGKTAFVEGVGCDLISKGYDVYKISGDGDDLIHDIQVICRRKGKKALIVESAGRNWDSIKQFYISKGEDDILLLTMKTAFVDTWKHQIIDFFSENDLYFVDLDTLAEADIQDLSNLLSVYKFWGARDAWSELAKRKFIEHDCNYQLSSALLEIVKSPGIRGRFDALLKRIAKDDAVGRFLVIASVLLLLEFRISDFLLTELVSDADVRTASLGISPDLSEVLSKTNGEFQFRSSIIAKYALNEYPNSKILVDQLISITKEAHHRAGFDGMGEMFFEVYRSLVTFSVIQSMLPEKGKRDSLIRFYENVKNLDSARNHPHFWLQYALARLAYDAEDDLDKAKLYLDTAYARAAKIEGYHTQHMDNVYARYLVKRAIKTVDFGDAFSKLQEAHAILIRQARAEKNHVPYRVSRLYSTFYSVHKEGIKATHSDEFSRYFEELLDIIPYLDLGRVGNIEVDSWKREMEAVLNDLRGYNKAD